MFNIEIINHPIFNKEQKVFTFNNVYKDREFTLFGKSLDDVDDHLIWFNCDNEDVDLLQLHLNNYILEVIIYTDKGYDKIKIKPDQYQAIHIVEAGIDIDDIDKKYEFKSMHLLQRQDITPLDY